MALAGEELEELGPAEIDADDLSSEAPEAELSVALGRGESAWHMYFSDLTYDYVKLNAEYTT
jgi:N-acetylglutamate synthase/N-acetylornithine aminotransferase